MSNGIPQETLDGVLGIIKPLWKGTARKGADIGAELGIDDGSVRGCVAYLRKQIYLIGSEVGIGYFYGKSRGDLDQSYAEYHARIKSMLDTERALKYMRDCLNAGMSPDDIRNLSTNEQFELL